MTIHDEHPFRDPVGDPARRLRARLGGAVTLWTSSSGRPAGLTVSSVLVALGEPPLVVGLLDPDSDLHDVLTASGRGVLQLLEWRHRDLADVFADVAPAPGGKFAQAPFEETPWGPRLADATTWAALVLEEVRPAGWSAMATCRIEQVELGDDDDALLHRRGRYERPGGAGTQ